MACLSMNEWSCIAKHIDVKDWPNFALICKSSNSGLKKRRYLKEFEKLCMKCGGKTIKHHHDENMGGDLCYEFFKRLGYEGMLCLSSYEGGEIWHICFDCQTIHLECPKCQTYCRLVGFPAEEANEGKRMHVVERNGRRLFEEMKNCEDYEDTYPEGHIPVPKEWNWCFLDRRKWYFAGADGSRHSKLECKTCEYAETFYD